jgi:Family of unknown function (DUF6459)
MNKVMTRNRRHPGARPPVRHDTRRPGPNRTRPIPGRGPTTPDTPEAGGNAGAGADGVGRNAGPGIGTSGGTDTTASWAAYPPNTTGPAHPAGPGVAGPYGAGRARPAAGAAAGRSRTGTRTPARPGAGGGTPTPDRGDAPGSTVTTASRAAYQPNTAGPAHPAGPGVAGPHRAGGARPAAGAIGGAADSRPVPVRPGVPQPPLSDVFADRLVAVLSGQRPVHCMLRYTAGRAYDELAWLAERGPLRGGRYRPVVRDVGWYEVRSGAVEVFARVGVGGRLRAMAFRLERGSDLRWRCTAVEVDGPRRPRDDQDDG